MFDLFGVGSLVNGAVQGITGAVTAGLNYKNQVATREMQERQYQQTFDYQRQQDIIQREREDTALQRKVDDARNAGLSPLAALGSTGASTSGTNVTGQQPSYVTPTYDTSQLNAGLATMQQGMTTKYLEDKKTSSLEAKFNYDLTLQTNELQAKLDIVKQQIQSQENMQGKELDFKQKEHLDNIEVAIEQINSYAFANTQELQLKADQSLVEYMQKTYGVFNVRYVKDEDYDSENQIWLREFKKVIDKDIDELEKTPIARSQSKSESKSGEGFGSLIDRNWSLSEGDSVVFEGLDYKRQQNIKGFVERNPKPIRLSDKKVISRYEAKKPNHFK